MLMFEHPPNPERQPQSAEKAQPRALSHKEDRVICNQEWQNRRHSRAHTGRLDPRRVLRELVDDPNQRPGSIKLLSGDRQALAGWQLRLPWEFHAIEGQPAALVSQS